MFLSLVIEMENKGQGVILKEWEFGREEKYEFTYQNPCPSRSMRISINQIDGSLGPDFATPESSIRHEKKLFLFEVEKTREVLSRIFIFLLTPCCECRVDSACVCDVFAQCEFPVDV